MTAFSPANIPSEVNTLEKLGSWVLLALSENNSNLTVQSAAGTIEPVISAQIIRLPNELTDPLRLVCVAYIPLLADWGGKGKLYSKGVKELSQTALPAGYTAN
jgi:hemolysin-activating ACP:hemolysin acyltransferase